MSYTEGAWYTERQEDLDPDGNGYVWAIKERQLSEEKDSNGGWKHYVQNPAYANSEANARLIAAAPELLESLRDLLGYIEATDDDIDHTEMCLNTGDAVLNAEAAIAKATGGQEEER
jgi:hypothetical protein